MAIDDDRSMARSSRAVSDFDSEVLLRRAKLKAMVTVAVAGMLSYVAIAAILVWWAIERPDHMDAVLYIMYPVLALPVLTLVSTWNRIRKIDV